MSGDLLDLVLIALASAFAVAGYRQGFIIGVLSFVGFTGGALAGIYLAPGIATVLTSRQNLQAVLAIIGVFAAAVAGMLVASAFAVLLRSRVTGRPSTLLDSIGGAAVNVVAILVLAWLIGSLVAYAPPFPAIAREIQGSLLLRSVDHLIPQGARPKFTALRRLLSTQPYVQVFGALGAETALSVPKLDPHVLHSAGLRRDRNSVVKIEERHRGALCPRPGSASAPFRRSRAVRRQRYCGWLPARCRLHRYSGPGGQVRVRQRP